MKQKTRNNDDLQFIFFAIALGVADLVINWFKKIALDVTSNGCVNL